MNQLANKNTRLGLELLGRGSVLGVLLTLILLSTAAWGQLAGRGAVSGTVADSSGAVVAGATITVTNNATGEKQIGKTTDSGNYQIYLEPGKYVINYSAQGFKSYVQENVTVNATQVVTVDVKLTAGAATEEVVVTDAPPVLETSNATMGTTIQQEMYSALPVIQDGGGQRRATDFASLMPGVQSSVTNGNLGTNAGVVNGSGSRGAVSAIYINGMPLTAVTGEGDPRFVWTAMAIEAIEQFQVLTNGYSAIYEGQGVQNYNVKRGSNKVHGSLFEFFRNTSLDTWGFTKVTDPITNKMVKPVERQNEYGITIGFPVLKDRLFLFTSYDGYRFSRTTPPQQMTIPTLKMRQGDFSEFGTLIYDPDTTLCNKNVCTRQPFNYNGTNAMAPSRISQQAKFFQSFLPNPTFNDRVTNNYVSSYATGLNNWNTTNRIDYTINSRQSVSAVLAWGRQATTAPAAVTIGSSSNGMPPPYVSGQQFAPKTQVFLLEHNFIVTPTIVNQLKFGFGRYDGPGFNQSINPKWSTTAAGMTGLPAGQASDSFPTVTFSGNTNINRWAGYSSNRGVANAFVLLDNLVWSKGKHTFTFGGQIAWMQYNYLNNATGVNPLQLSFANSITASYKANSSTANSDGNGYASYLLGIPNSASFTQSSVPETGARYRPISPYIQDDWKINSRLTLNLGLRYDFYPVYREAQDRFSYFDPNKTNPLVGIPGALVFGGKGTNHCNCRVPVDEYYKNFGPRLGFAYQTDSKTVVRGSWGVIYTHGNANGGSATSRQGSGLMGYSVSPSITSPQVLADGLKGMSYWTLSQPYPTYTQPPTLDPSLGTYYTTLSSAASQNPTYADPYYGGRAPQFLNWSIGLQRQLTKDAAVTISYVGSMGHFLVPDSLNGRGKWSNQLDPKWLGLASALSNKATAANLQALGLTAPFASFDTTTATKANISTALKPFPQYAGISDAYGFVGNTRYDGLQIYATQRVSHGLTFMTNYTWSKSIDNNGNFRSGYDIPAAYAADKKFHKARSLDRSLSLSDQRHRFVFTGVYDLPFGKGSLGGNNAIAKAIAGGWKLSGIYQVYSGGPLAITMNTCNTNPSQSVCQPVVAAGYKGDGTKKATLPRTASNLGLIQRLDPAAFTATPDYTFSTAARTAALSGLFQPGNYKLDMSLRRTIGLPLGFHEGTKLSFQVDGFNVTNHTHFVFSQSNAALSTWAANSTSYGVQVVDSGQSSRQIQLAARIEF